MAGVSGGASTPGYYTGFIHWSTQVSKDLTHTLACPVRLGDLQAQGNGASIIISAGFNCVRDMMISKVTSKTILTQTTPLLTKNQQNLNEQQRQDQQNQGDGGEQGQQQQNGDETQQQNTGTQTPTTPPQQTEEVTYGYLKIQLHQNAQTKEGKPMKYLELPLTTTLFPRLKDLEETYTAISKSGVCKDYKDVETCITEEENKWLLPPEPTTATTTTPPSQAQAPGETKTQRRWMFSNLHALELILPDLKLAQEQFASAQKFLHDAQIEDDNFLSIPNGVNKLAWSTLVKKLSTQIATTSVIGSTEARVSTLKDTIQEIKVVWDQLRGSMFMPQQKQVPTGNMNPQINSSTFAFNSAFVLDEKKYRNKVKILYGTPMAAVAELSTDIGERDKSLSHVKIPANFNVLSDLTGPTLTFPYLPWIADQGTRALNQITGSILMVDGIPVAVFHSEGYGASFKAIKGDITDDRQRTGEKATMRSEQLQALQAVTIQFKLRPKTLANTEEGPDNKETSKELKTLEEKLAQIEKNNKEAKIEQQKLQKRIDALQTQLKEAQSNDEQDQETINNLQKELREEKGRSAKLETQLQDSENEKSGLNERITALEQQPANNTPVVSGPQSQELRAPPISDNVCM